MPSTGDFLDYVMDLLSEVDDVSSRKMMGEFVLYSGGVVFGGIYDDRFLIKVTASSRGLVPDAQLVSPYPGAKEMIVVDTEDPRFISRVVRAMVPELPLPKKRKR